MNLPIRFAVPAALCTALIAMPASSGRPTFVVDDDGGPDVDFTSISEALAVVPEGALVLVLEGSYGSFVADRAVSLVGAPGARVTGVTSRVEAQGKRVRIVGLRFNALRIHDSQEVLLEDVEVRLGSVPGAGEGPCVITDSNVRIAGSVFEGDGAFYGLSDPGLFVESSRVEFVDSRALGGDGYDTDFCTEVAGYGGHGIVARGSSRLILAASTAAGGEGGDGYTFLCSSYSAGDGGHGLVLEQGTTVVVQGAPDDRLSGGYMGYGGYGYGDGEAATLEAGSSLRHSGVSIGPGAVRVYSGSTETPVPADPTLVRGAALVHGQDAQYVVLAEPGSRIRLRHRVDRPSGFELFVPSVNLGRVPPGGELNASVPLPADAMPGDVVVATATVAFPSGERRQTNVAAGVVR